MSPAMSALAWCWKISWGVRAMTTFLMTGHMTERFGAPSRWRAAEPRACRERIATDRPSTPATAGLTWEGRRLYQRQSDVVVGEGLGRGRGAGDQLQLSELTAQVEMGGVGEPVKHRDNPPGELLPPPHALERGLGVGLEQAGVLG